MSIRRKIVVVGGNAAGPAAAAKAKRVDPDAEVILFEAGEYISTGTCELPYLFSGEIDDYRKIIFFSPAEFEQQKKVKVFTRHVVTKINRRLKKLEVLDLSGERTYEQEYDKLILAIGSRAAIPTGISSGIDNHFTFKKISDYLKINSFIEKNSAGRCLIIGSGYIGLELADALTSRGLKIILCEAAADPFPNGEPEIQQYILKEMGKRDIRFIGNFNPETVVRRENKLGAVKIDGRLYEIDFVISAGGVYPNSGLASSAGLEIGTLGGIKIDRRCKTSDPHIYAVGDAVELPDLITRRNGYFPLATHAKSTGHIAGENAAGGNLFIEPIVGNYAFRFFDSIITQTGLSSMEASDYFYDADSITAEGANLVTVMPGSRRNFGKIIYNTSTGNIIGSSFIGGKEVVGYADLTAAFITNGIPATRLKKINYSYTPPSAPFINLLSILGRKIK